MRAAQWRRVTALRDVLARTLTDPLLSVLAVLVVFAAVWFAVNFARPLAFPVVAWTPGPLSFTLAAFAAARAGRTVALAAPARSFWRRLSVAAGLITVALISNAHDALTGSGPQIQYVGPLTIGLYLGGVLVALWALARLPEASRSRKTQLTLGLDAGVVMLAAALFAGYFTVRSSSQLSALTGSVWWGLTVVTLGFVTILAAVRLALAGSAPLDRLALSVLGLGVLAGALGGALTPLVEAKPHLHVGQVSVPIAAFLFALSAGLQRSVAARPAPLPRRRRPFSLLPYAAIAATDALLLFSTWPAGPEIRVIVIGAITLTGLVAVRQITAFYDNANLLARLDASMLELGRHEQRFRSLVQNSSDVITINDVSGKYTYISPSVEAILGIPTDQWLGRSVHEFVHPDDRGVMREMGDLLRKRPGTTATCQVRMRHADGSWRWAEVVSTNQMDDPSIRGIVSNTRDITETRRFQDQLAHEATHDALTLLANRALFTEQAVGALAESPHRGVALALIDLDDFKTVNDRLGHAVGDALLVAVADRLRECVRRGDTVARLGGDEFAVLLRDVTSAEADRIAQEIIAALGAPVGASGHELLVQASIGLVDGGSGMDASELLRRADVAMYAAKEQGKSRYVRYTDDMDTRAVEHARVGAELRHALSAGELFLLYQPVVTLPGGGLSGVEALVRWRHPERGLVSPAEFIPVAERTGMIVEVGAWVLGEACRQMAAWKQRYGDAAPAKMSVNVSARQLREPAFGQTVAEALEATGLRPADLLLEITETAVFDGGPALETVHTLHALGVNLALDDFGTGHSSLGLLRTCPVDVLKVDKLFVDGVTGSVEQAAIATSMAHIAQAMRLRAVAEGVETADQARRLYQLGYRLAQGFHFARPLPPEEIEPWLAERAAGDGPDRWAPSSLAG
ncbi:EAL domain-containing protein [Planomonospora sp. ID67723]|uniref:putative bifunctional diguanylate cyclase/phosphodiesterase n=1 Tax=Planomonospora sp. ID67723 TaxID=2738134 RepID=UPI0018C3B031|nr:EAL domain-containing protein [Planomonospora sp. ID67723]MBG0833043.1 EAL domain-containing protein [Planomonospora sp. ID67723]